MCIHYFLLPVYRSWQWQWIYCNIDTNLKTMYSEWTNLTKPFVPRKFIKKKKHIFYHVPYGPLCIKFFFWQGVVRGEGQDVYKRQSVFSMANDNCRIFKQNQIIFCIQPWFVEYSRPIVFGEDRLRERGSLPGTAVSYTHLDVYKRQVCVSVCRFFFYGKR